MNLDGLHLLRGETRSALDVGTGSLARFSALRTLYLRQAAVHTMIPCHPRLPTGLRYVACSPRLARSWSATQMLHAQAMASVCLHLIARDGITLPCHGGRKRHVTPPNP